MRALIVPRPGAEPGEHWYPYVCQRVDAGVIPGLTAAEVRAPGPDDVEAAGSLLLIGHEDAAEEIQSFLSTLTAGRAAAGVLLVTPGAEASDWRAAGPLRVLLSDDAGYEEAEHGWTERHGAEVAVRPGGKRFHGAHEVAVLVNLAALVMEVAEAGS